MKNLLVHSTGYARPFPTDALEQSCRSGSDCKWSPSSLDFAAMGEKSGGSLGANSVSQLLELLEKQPKASIKELRVVGHGNESYFSFAGTILPQDVAFTESACLGNSLTFNSQVKRLQRLADRFTRSGTITVFGCNTGRSSGTLLNFLSKSFLVPVRGFVGLIDYLQPAVGTPRGMYRYRSLGHLFEAAWEINAWKANPDAASQIVSLAPAKARRSRQSGGNQVAEAANVLWDMVHQYFLEEAQLIAGTGYYPATELSLATVVEGSKKTIDVSQGFLDNLSPETLHWRLRELRVALDLLQEGKARPIALQK